MDPADSVQALEHTLRIEFETKLAVLRSDLDRKIADIGREDARVLQLEIKLKQSEEAKEEYRKEIVGLREKIREMELREKVKEMALQEKTEDTKLQEEIRKKKQDA
jgi:CII-binding regulator of phage lambda lysogenization HflD